MMKSSAVYSSWFLVVAFLLSSVVDLQPTSAFTAMKKSPSTSRSQSSSSTSLNTLPKLIVFDLDNTIWTPELYQLRKLQRNNQAPVAGRDVELLPGFQDLLDNYLPELQQKGVEFGVASRTKSVEWAHALLGQFDLQSLFSHVQIFPGHKRQHFQKIQQSSGYDYHEMLFLDDARDGRYGNCEPVSQLGCFSVHCPNGLTTSKILLDALDYYKEWNKQPGTIMEADGSLSVSGGFDRSLPQERITGSIHMVKDDKKYGFIRYRQGKSRDIFFHFNNIDMSLWDKLAPGLEVSFRMQRDAKNGKTMATEIRLEGEEGAVDDSDFVEAKCFSMNNPFAALLANGYKTLETRNGTMFEVHPPGTILCLHVGQRIYPDGDKHLDIMKRDESLSDEDIQSLKQMPQGYGKGNIVAIMELGKTYLTTTKERSRPEFERQAAAYGADSGKYATEIRRVAYLKRPVRQSGQPGIFKVRIPADAIPEGWELAPEASSSSQEPVNGERVAYASNLGIDWLWK